MAIISLRKILTFAPGSMPPSLLADSNFSNVATINIGADIVVMVPALCGMSLQSSLNYGPVTNAMLARVTRERITPVRDIARKCKAGDFEESKSRNI